MKLIRSLHILNIVYRIQGAVSTNRERNMNRILGQIYDERKRQERLQKEGKFRYTCADLELSNAECMAVLSEEVGEVAREVTEQIIVQGKDDGSSIAHVHHAIHKRMRKELIEVAAVCVGWIEKLDKVEQAAKKIDTLFEP